MKVTSPTGPVQSNGVEVAAFSVHDIIKITNGTSKHRHVCWKHTAPMSAVSLSGVPCICKKSCKHYMEAVRLNKSPSKKELSDDVDDVSYTPSVVESNLTLSTSFDALRDGDNTFEMLTSIVCQHQHLFTSGTNQPFDQNPLCSCRSNSGCAEVCELSSKSVSQTVCTDSSDDTILAYCKWDNCASCKVDANSLLEHIRLSHVATQVKPLCKTLSVRRASESDDEPSYVCLWAGCKVYNKASCLLSWLERHIQCHVGTKPHRCIVAGCGASFASQIMLERHVNGHFAMIASSSMNALRPTRKSDINSKLMKKRKHRLLRPCPAKANDYFDSCVMESIRKELLRNTEHFPWVSETTSSRNLMPFQCSVIARRITARGTREVLIQWKPSKVLPDEWLLEAEAASLTIRTLPLFCLPPDIHEIFSLPKSLAKHFHRHRRK